MTPLMLTLLVHVAAEGLVPKTYAYPEAVWAEGKVETSETFDPATGKLEAAVVDVRVDSATFLGAATRREIPPGDHRARVVYEDDETGAETVLADGVVRRAEVGHDDPGDDPADPLPRWTVRVADRALETTERALDRLDVSQPGFAGALTPVTVETGTTFDDGETDVAGLPWYDLSELARLAVERAGATVEAWPADLAGLDVAPADGPPVRRAGRVCVRTADAPTGDAAGAAPEWTGKEAVERASVYRRLALRCRYADFPSPDVVASLVDPGPLPASLSGLVAIDGAERRPWAEAGELAPAPDLVVGFQDEADDVPPPDVHRWSGAWLRSGLAKGGGAGGADLTVDAGVRFAHVAVTETVSVPVRPGYVEPVAVGTPVVYSDESGVVACLVAPDAAPDLAVAYRRTPAGQRHELAANHWFSAHADRAADADTAALTVDLADAEASGLPAGLGSVSAGDVVAWGGAAWRVASLTRRHDDGQLDLDLWRASPVALSDATAGAGARSTAPPRLFARIQRDPGGPTGWVAVADPRPGLLGDGTAADAPDRFVVEVDASLDGSGDWVASTGVEEVLEETAHVTFRARAEYDAEGVVTAYTVASTEGASTDPEA